MFEHSLYEPERVATPLQEGDLFYDYEIKNWEFSPRIYKILAASAVFNILALLVFAQTNILQARACDSPWVGRVWRGATRASGRWGDRGGVMQLLLVRHGESIGNFENRLQGHED